jgi:uncharacterized protein (DUF1015 family)
MADLQPFAAWRYDPAAVGSWEDVITQPYDKISPAMLPRYLERSPFNLARVIKTADYSAAAAHLTAWKEQRALIQDPAPALYPYFQQYAVPGTGELRTRKAVIAALRLEDYTAGVVHRHEWTLSGPKQDRLELLRATRMQCELIFLLHDDPGGRIAALVESAASGEPLASLRDDYGDRHTVWRCDRPETAAALAAAFASLPLLIADGHHRYETALAYRGEYPDADRVLVALVSMDEPGLTILPTHRVLARAPGFSHEKLLACAARFFDIRETSVEAGRREVARHTIGAAFAGSFFLMRLKDGAHLEALLPDVPRLQRRLDVVLLHQLILKRCLSIDEEATRQERNLDFVREFDAGLRAVAAGAPACFFLHPVSIEEVRAIAFAGGVMPQKSTDFYPKMLSGLVMLEL